MHVTNSADKILSGAVYRFYINGRMSTWFNSEHPGIAPSSTGGPCIYVGPKSSYPFPELIEICGIYYMCTVPFYTFMPTFCWFVRSELTINIILKILRI